jgi:hypothetical protein
MTADDELFIGLPETTLPNMSNRKRRGQSAEWEAGGVDLG